MSRTIPTLIAASALALTLTACGGDPVDDTTTNEKYIKGMDKVMANLLCEKNVKKKLKSPSTAEFARITEVSAEQSTDQTKWVIRTHVDSQNSFGATVRSQVVCDVIPKGRDSADVESVII